MQAKMCEKYSIFAGLRHFLRGLEFDCFGKLAFTPKQGCSPMTDCIPVPYLLFTPSYSLPGWSPSARPSFRRRPYRSPQPGCRCRPASSGNQPACSGLAVQARRSRFAGSAVWHQLQRLGKRKFHSPNLACSSILHLFNQNASAHSCRTAKNDSLFSHNCVLLKQILADLSSLLSRLILFRYLEKRQVDEDPNHDQETFKDDIAPVHWAHVSLEEERSKGRIHDIAHSDPVQILRYVGQNDIDDRCN